MSAKKPIRPTDAELEILRVLWSQGPSTVRQVHRVMGPAKGTSYNTTLKFLLIMHEKGLVTRDESERPQVYAAAVPEKQMQRHLVRDLLQRAFGGSASKLVAALTSTKLSTEEKASIRRLLDGTKGDER